MPDLSFGLENIDQESLEIINRVAANFGTSVEEVADAMSQLYRTHSVSYSFGDIIESAHRMVELGFLDNIQSISDYSDGFTGRFVDVVNLQYGDYEDFKFDYNVAYTSWGGQEFKLCKTVGEIYPSNNLPQFVGSDEIANTAVLKYIMCRIKDKVPFSFNDMGNTTLKELLVTTQIELAKLGEVVKL